MGGLGDLVRRRIPERLLLRGSRQGDWIRLLDEGDEGWRLVCVPVEAGPRLGTPEATAVVCSDGTASATVFDTWHGLLRRAGHEHANVVGTALAAVELVLLFEPAATDRRAGLEAARRLLTPWGERMGWDLSLSAPPAPALRDGGDALAAVGARLRAGIGGDDAALGLTGGIGGQLVIDGDSIAGALGALWTTHAKARDTTSQACLQADELGPTGEWIRLGIGEGSGEGESLAVGPGEGEPANETVRLLACRVAWVHGQGFLVSEPGACGREMLWLRRMA